MSQRSIVALALLWTGALVALSRHWLGDARDYVERVTGKHIPTSPGGRPGVT